LRVKSNPGHDLGGASNKVQEVVVMKDGHAASESLGCRRISHRKDFLRQPVGHGVGVVGAFELEFLKYKVIVINQ